MKILFDFCVFEIQKIGGVSKALLEMMGKLPSDIEIEIAIKESDNVYLHEQNFLKQSFSYKQHTIDRFLPNVQFRGKERIYSYLAKAHLIQDSHTRNLEFCKGEMRSGKYDILHHTHYNSYFLPYNKKPFVFIIHDLIPELFSHYYSKTVPDINQRDILIKEASHVVAISENTKRDVLNRWKISEDKITSIPWGAPDVSNTVFNKIVDYPYLLYVGGRDGYKRFDYFVQNAKEFLLRHPEIHVICTGVPFSKKENVLLSEMGVKDRFHTMFVSTDELYSLYHYAICFIFPSLYEGFGLPTLEAMSCGCPVLISNRSCFPEIGGDVALYIEDSEKGSSNVASQLDNIYRMSGTERDALIKKGLSLAR